MKTSRRNREYTSDVTSWGFETKASSRNTWTATVLWPSYNRAFQPTGILWRLLAVRTFGWHGRRNKWRHIL